MATGKWFLLLCTQVIVHVVFNMILHDQSTCEHHENFGKRVIQRLPIFDNLYDHGRKQKYFEEDHTNKYNLSRRKIEQKGQDMFGCGRQ
ncbi:hypothetical protein CASFOL_017224 [Castilleja foliolosa]|uniref:Uncharacterized protein n=1 Tax=Castilleja foliolosa TaxID=1961234 RepID=A0ABD3DER4_9LAMI